MRWLVFLHAAVPVFGHLLRRRHLQRPNDAEAEELRVGMIPDALGQLRVLHLPRFVGRPPRGAAKLLRRVIPRAAPYGVRIRFRRLDPWIDNTAAAELFVD